MMGFLKGKSPEALKWQGVGLFFVGGALGLASRRIEDDLTAMALLVPCVVLLMLAIASLARSATAPSEVAE